MQREVDPGIRYPYFCTTVHLLTGHVGQAAALECVFEEMRIPPHSPDLAPSVSKFKEHLRGQRFSTTDEIKTV